MGDLPDVNVWLALAVKQHLHYDAAAVYWNDQGTQSGTSQSESKLWFCRITMLGLVRRLSQSKVMADQVLNLAQAIAAYQTFAALPEVGLHNEPANCASELQRVVSTDLSSRLLTDAY